MLVTSVMTNVGKIYIYTWVALITINNRKQILVIAQLVIRRIQSLIMWFLLVANLATTKFF
jgi:hypothetical protein